MSDPDLDSAPLFVGMRERSNDISGEFDEAEIRARYISLDVNFCKDHCDKIEVPDPLAVEDLISSKLNNKRKLARLPDYTV